jgi:hypothetical protein
MMAAMGSSRSSSKAPRGRSAGRRHAPDRTTATSPPYLATVYLAGLAVAIVICFQPLTTYFFAQDDFLLIGKAAFYPTDSITDFFAHGPGHFRPLSKGLYFVAANRLFGMQATPYHLVSLLLHIFNVVMTYRLLRRLGVGELAGLAAVSLFALSAGYFHVLAWISCVQQLLTLAFVLVSLEFGMRTIDGGPPRDRWISFVAYAGALGSAEQALFVPAVLVLYAIARPGGPRLSLRDGVHATVEQWGLLAAFAVFVLVWRTIPDEGTYAFRLGPNGREPARVPRVVVPLRDHPSPRDDAGSTRVLQGTPVLSRTRHLSAVPEARSRAVLRSRLLCAVAATRSLSHAPPVLPAHVRTVTGDIS